VGLLASVAIPDRNAVPPAELTRDAPRAQVAHPVEQQALPGIGRDDSHAIGLDGLDRRLREFVHPAEPLKRDQRLDLCARAMAVALAMDVGLALRDRAELVEGADHGVARLGDRQAREPLSRRLGHAPVLADHGYLRQTVLTADLEVVRVV